MLETIFALNMVVCDVGGILYGINLHASSSIPKKLSLFIFVLKKKSACFYFLVRSGMMDKFFIKEKIFGPW